MSNPAMTDFDYVDLMQWMIDDEEVRFPFTSPEMGEAISAFYYNLERIGEFVTVLSNVAVSSSIMQMRRDAAAMRLFGNLQPPSETDYAARNDAIEADTINPVTGFDELNVLCAEAGGVNGFIFGARRVANILRWGDLSAASGTQQIMGATIVSAWTAFEVLAEDLWKAAVNSRLVLAFLAVDAEPLADDDPATQERKSKVKFQFPAWKFQDADFDPRTQMGEVLKDKWDFARKDRAKDAYTKIFPELTEQITSIFQSDSLRWITACRNAIVHNCGRADREFVKLVHDHPEFGKLSVKSEIPLSATTVRSMISAVVDQGKALIDLVDNWLKNHPK